MHNTAVIITNEGLGQGDKTLRLKLANNFFLTLHEGDFQPKSLLFYGDGVKLCVAGSNCVDSLRLLEGAGVALILCRTCLEHYGLLDHVAVGSVGNMLDIAEEMRHADKVITA